MKTGRAVSRLIVVGVLVFGMSSVSVSAGGPVTVEGTVVDINGNPLRGVEVMALAADSEEPITASTKKKGTFSKEGFEIVSTEFVPGPEELIPLDVTLALEGEISEARELAIPVFNEGVTALEAGDKPAALERFRQASEIDPDFADAARATAAVAVELEDFATAADAGENLVRLQPDNLDAISTAYFAELMLLDMVRFIPSAKRLADANPGVVSNEMVQHATVLSDNNELAGSRALLELVIERAPENTAAYLQLGLVCNMAGDPVCAKDALKRYLELAPDGPDAATARSLLDYLQ